jgi:hypothetical protein
MAHTDRDNERIARRNHWLGECPNCYRYALREYGKDWYRLGLMEQRCEVCMREPHRKNRYVGTEGKNHWNREQRQAERGKAKQALRQCRDYDDLSFRYHRPYWD